MKDNPTYQEWLSQQNLSSVDENKLRQNIIDDLTKASVLSQSEYTLWRKWQKLNLIYKNATPETLEDIKRIKQKIWIPKKPEDYLKLEPEVVYVKQQFPIRRISIWGNESFAFLSNPDPLNIDWTILGDFISSGDPSAGGVGRSLRFLVRDKKTKKYLGILCLANDYLDLKGRDEAIGWTRESRSTGGRIEHSAVGAVIVPTQPLGFSYLGGKLMSLLLLSEPICETWEQVYGKKLAGITTTSLYGTDKSATQYDGMRKYWRNYGHSTGSTSLRPSIEYAEQLKEWMKSKHPEEYWKFYQAKRASGLPLVRDSNERARIFCYSKLNIPRKLYKSLHQRGIYYSRFYDKSFEFLRGDITEKQLGRNKRFDNSPDELFDVWKRKYAEKRVVSLIKTNRFSFESSFYSELLSLSWDETKERYC